MFWQLSVTSVILMCLIPEHEGHQSGRGFQVALFKPDWWPTSNRNGGPLRAGLGGPHAPEHAPIDMRYGFERLSFLICEEIGGNLDVGDLFVFLGNSTSLIVFKY